MAVTVVKNKVASALARLRNKAKQLQVSYQHCLQLFFQEEFLRRLSLSGYADKLVLKGGYFLYTLSRFTGRPTVDVDLLMQRMSNDEHEVKRMVADIIAADTGNDYVSFAIKGMKPIALDKKYPGVSVQLVGMIQNVRVPFSVDMGIGDVIVPGAQLREIGAMLENFDMPRIWTYSIESTIAEKFDAMLQKMEINSRMKDFYDIYYLSHHFSFDGETISKAIGQTLQNRGTLCTEELFARVVALAHHPDMIMKWGHFQRAQKCDLEFAEVMQDITRFLQPVVAAMVQDVPFGASWSPGGEWQ